MNLFRSIAILIIITNKCDLNFLYQQIIINNNVADHFKYLGIIIISVLFVLDSSDFGLLV